MLLLSSKTTTVQNHTFYPGEVHEVDTVIYDHFNNKPSHVTLKDLDIEVEVSKNSGFTFIKSHEEEILESCKKIESIMSNKLVIEKLDKILNRIDKLDMSNKLIIEKLDEILNRIDKLERKLSDLENIKGEK